ncbi:MAG: FkbM family methyltransferase [Bacteroidota bacterium]
MLRRQIKRFLPRLPAPLIRSLLRAERRWRPAHFPSYQHLLAQFAQLHSDVYFVQIGAHEGDYSDPIYQQVMLHQWQGLLVEPQSTALRQLRHHYRHAKGLSYEQSAISDQSGKQTFYFFRPAPELPHWVSQLSSFHRPLLEAVQDRLPTAIIDSQDMNCLSLSELLAKHQVNKLDLLMIDAEGHDFHILRQLDFARHSPRLIFYEHCHLSSSDQKAAHQLLRDQGYALYPSSFNTIGLRDPQLIKQYQPYLMMSSD